MADSLSMYHKPARIIVQAIREIHPMIGGCTFRAGDGSSRPLEGMLSVTDPRQLVSRSQNDLSFACELGFHHVGRGHLPPATATYLPCFHLGPVGGTLRGEEQTRRSDA